MTERLCQAVARRWLSALGNQPACMASLPTTNSLRTLNALMALQKQSDCKLVQRCDAAKINSCRIFAESEQKLQHL